MEDNKKDSIILDKMRSVRDMSEMEIFYEQSAKESTRPRFVQDVLYIGKIELENQELDMFIVEEVDGENSKFKVVDENGNKIATITDKGVIFTREELSVDKMEELQKVFLQAIPQKDLNKMESKELYEIAKELGQDKENIKKLSLLDLDKKIDDKEESKQKKENKDEEKEIDEQEVKKIRILQETRVNAKVDETNTLGKRINMEKYNQVPNSKFVKLAVVYAESIKDIDKKNIDSTRYSFVGIRADGSAQRLDDIFELDNTYGNTASKETLKFDADGTARKDNKINSRYKIKGTDDTMAVENGEYGQLKVYYGGKEKSSNDITETQLETNNVRPTSREIRETQSKKHGDRHRDEENEEANKHFDAGEEKISLKDADGNQETKTHTHEDEYTEENPSLENDYVPETTITWREFANECGYRGEGSIEHAQDVFKKELNDPKNVDKTYEEIVENIIEDKNQDYRENNLKL